MKAFEMWFNGSVCAIGDADALKRHKSRYASAWLAALEKVLSWCKKMEEDGWDYTANTIEDRINRELEDTE